MSGYTSAVGAEGPMTESTPPLTGAARLAAAGRRTELRVAAATLIIGLIITAVLTALSSSVYSHNEHRLLRLRVGDAAAVISSALPGLQTPLASAAELAEATNGSPSRFRTFAAAYVGAGRGFVSLSLWDLRHLARGPLAVAGALPELAVEPNRIGPFFAHVLRGTRLSVVGLLNSNKPRLGYGYSTPGASRYAAYAESALPRSRYTPVQANSPFIGLHFVIYLNQVSSADLVATNVHHLPLTGGVTDRVPFGDSSFIVRMTAAGSLAGGLPQELPWIIAIGGLLLSLAAAAGALRLTERRLRAERLAGELELVATENRQLYAEQRGIAQTLQHALLPEELPQVPGIQASGQYRAGDRSVDIGGDWYDVIAVDDNSLLVAVGDVSGRGLRAATTMAALRFAIQAYAAEEHSPDLILGKLAGLLSLTREGQLATALCARIDVRRRSVTVSSAGHLPPLLLSGNEARYLEVPVGVPIGVDPRAKYGVTTYPVEPGATLLAFTDGLVERRGEQLDDGLARLRDTAMGNGLALGPLLGKLVADLSVGGAKDDIAIVGLRWTS